MAENASDTPAPVPAKSGMVGLLVNGLGIFVLCTAAVVAGGFLRELLQPPQRLKMEKGQLVLAAGETHGESGKTASLPALYFAFDPPFVVNFDDAEQVRFLQLQVQVMARDAAVIEAVQRHDPMIRNSLLLLLNGRDYPSLMTRAGKEALRAECLKTVQELLRRETGKAGVEDLYFTSFVVQ